MKKKKVWFIFFTVFCMLALVFFPSTIVEANAHTTTTITLSGWGKEMLSTPKITGPGAEKNSSKVLYTGPSSYTKKYLVQTGEERSMCMSVMGGTILLLLIIVIIVKKKNLEGEYKQ